MKTIGLTDQEAERLRSWQKRQQDNQHGHLIPTKLPDSLSFDKYLDWMENEYLNQLAKKQHKTPVCQFSNKKHITFEQKPTGLYPIH